MSAYADFPERTIAQALVVVKAYCNAMGRVPVGVRLLWGLPSVDIAWRKAAVDYLTAKAKGVKSIHQAVQLEDD